MMYWAIIWIPLPIFLGRYKSELSRKALEGLCYVLSQVTNVALFNTILVGLPLSQFKTTIHQPPSGIAQQMVAVIGIALIAMAEELGAEMALRSYGNLLRYNLSKVVVLEVQLNSELSVKQITMRHMAPVYAFIILTL